MELFVAPGSLCELEARISARYAGVDLKVHVDSSMKVPELRTARGFVVRGPHAVLRFIAGVVPSCLFGRGFFNESIVDQWMDFAASELLKPCEALLAGAKLQPKVAEAFADGLDRALSALDQRLAAPAVFLAGNEVTLADVTVYCTLRKAFGDAMKQKFANVARWVSSMEQQPHVAACLQQSAKPAAQSAPENRVVTHSFGGRLRVVAIFANGGDDFVGQTVKVAGWARTVRIQGGGNFAFVEVNDGSCFQNLQVVVDKTAAGFDDISKNCTTGASVMFVGEIVRSPGAKQKVEMQVRGSEHKAQVVGTCDGKSYPLAKKQHSLEYLREIAHLRPRTNTIGAVTRLRNAMAFATHSFFQSKGFLYIHTPLITASDCEGAGEMFGVTTLFGKDGKAKVPLMPDGSVDYSKDFFAKRSFLTVSGQLNVENFCCSLSDVYTFGPTFRAELSHTYRHLAEFWMIEPEMAWADIHDNMNCAEAYLKYCLNWALEKCADDLAFFDKNIEPGLVARLRHVVDSEFAHCSYTEAVELINQSGKKFESGMPHWGSDLQSEHERYLAEEYFKRPVIVYNYPKEIKAFYMRLNEDGKTVAAMDVLVPKIGEVIGGSQREERAEVLDRRITESGLEVKSYWWYRDLRRYGSIPHSGFGLGFERLLMMVTGMENIRDVIPFPRVPGHAEF